MAPFYHDPFPTNRIAPKRILGSDLKFSNPNPPDSFQGVFGEYSPPSWTAGRNRLGKISQPSVLQSIAHKVAGNAQLAGGLGDIARARVQGLGEQLLFEFSEGLLQPKTLRRQNPRGIA